MKEHETKEYKTIEHGITYNQKKDTYYVNVGAFKVYSFPTLEDARKFRDDIRAAKLKKKTEEAIAKIYEKDGKEIKEECPYPFNVLEAINRPDADYSMFETFLSQCSEREWQCVYSYYHDGLTLQQIAKKFGVTRERIRQLVSKGLRKVACCYAMLSKKQELERQRERFQADLKTLNEYREQLVKLFKENGVYTEEMEIEFGKPTSKGRDEVVQCSLSESIDSLNLSIRSHNCLKRAGVETIDDLISHTYDEMRSVRNLGKRSLREIEEKLKERGYAFKENPIGTN